MLHDDVRKMRDDAVARGEEPVPESFQGVTKARVIEVLKVIDRESRDNVDAVFALLDDVHASWFPTAPKGSTISNGATVAHVACHVGILQRDGTKLDREGRDYWIKPLRDIGAIEPIYLDSKAGEFLVGHPIAKSPYSAYRLAESFVSIVRAEAWRPLLDEWIQGDKIRERLAFQAELAEATRKRVDTKHVDLIRACCDEYAMRFLPGFEVVYVDDADGDRISGEERERLAKAGLDLGLGDAMPDVLLWNPESNALWIIEAVTSDGEVDDHKMRAVRAFAARYGKSDVGSTTAYPTWRVAAQRQRKLKNIAVGSYVWIREDGSKHYRAETFNA